MDEVMVVAIFWSSDQLANRQNFDKVFSLIYVKVQMFKSHLSFILGKTYLFNDGNTDLSAIR